ncbi:hypothetical protein Tco_0409611 [Tanacetum coccineum]
MVDGWSSCKQFGFRAFFEKEKLYGPNFIDWFRNMRIVLTTEDKLTYLDYPPIPAPRQQISPDVLVAHTKWVKASKDISWLMLASMRPEL